MAKEPMNPALERAFDAARAAWPQIEVTPQRFAEEVQARLAGGIELASMHAADLYLAIALVAGDPAAFTAFEEQLGPEVLRSLERLHVRGAAAAELQQRLRHKLFIAAEGGAAPKIAMYSGKGPLRAWLRALVVHEVQNEHRKLKRDRTEPDAALTDLAADDDLEIAQMRARYAGPFREAFSDALAGLSVRDRNILRLVHIDGLPVEQVALMYGVHRVSVSRWLGKARSDLLDATRRRLREQLRLDDAELASVTRLCLSQIDVSLHRLLSA